MPATLVDMSRLAAALNDEGLDALETFARTTLVPMIRQAIPVGDPELDPDPAVSLRDKIEVRREGRQIVIEIDAEYAAVQNFSLYQHPRGGHSRFMDDSLQVASGFIENVIGEAIRQRLARSV